jgi:predicted metal-binding protein
MTRHNLKKYCNCGVKGGAANVKQIHTGSVITAPWVRLKCQFGCGGYGYSYCCPPHSPTPEETRKILDSYERALLFHVEAPASPAREKMLKKYRRMLIDLEGEMFKDGFYKAFVLLVGPCDLCGECGTVKGTPCSHGWMARPSMEACGIDVFQTARNNGFFIQTLREEAETRNIYCLMLVD